MRRLLAVGLGAALLAGCGSGGGGNTVLQRDASALADAARAGDAVAVQAALTQLRQDVAAEQTSGAVTAARGHQILAAAEVVAADVPLPKPLVTVSPTTSPRPRVATTRRKGEGKGKGKGDGGD